MKLSYVVRLVCCVLIGSGFLGLTGCGSNAVVSTATTVGQADEPVASPDEDDHADDEDHDDEDHDDEDHDDEDHDDEDHDEDVSGGLGAHVHGEAELFVGLSGGDVVVDLVSPAENIFGFEYEPETNEDKATAADRTEALASAGLLSFNAEAECELSAEVEPEVEFEGTHAEITTSWVYVCGNPAEISELDLSALFAEFPAMADIDAQWASDDMQSASELTPSSTVLVFG